MLWPEGTRESQKAHALKHVQSLEFAIGLCKRRRTAVQAGGNVGLWPRRMAQSFERVITFEPDDISRECLVANVRKLPNVEVRAETLGAIPLRCSISRASLGSHSVIDGADKEMVMLDVFGLDDVDLLQLDIEGYEFEALKGAKRTIRRSHPIIQIEMRGFVDRYGSTDAQVIEFLAEQGYREVGRQPGNDVIFTHG